MSKAIPLGLSNPRNNCWVNSLFQVIALDPVYTYLFRTFLPPQLDQWKLLLEEYKQQQSTEPSSLFKHDTQSLRSCLRLNESTQEDSHEGMMRLFAFLPDGTASVCSEHKRENMIPKKQGQKCMHENCKALASYGYDVNVWIPGRVIRYLEPTSEIVAVNEKMKREQLSVVEYENGVSPRLVSENKYSQILLPIPKQDVEQKQGVSSSLQFEDLLDHYAYTRLSTEQQYKKQALDREQRLRTHLVITEKWELAVDPVSGELPIMMPIVIERFTYSFTGNQFHSNKITRPVEIPFTVNFSHLFDRHVPAVQKFTFTDFQYELYAFIQHVSAQQSSGHYVAYVCISPPGTAPRLQTWYCCNDAIITRISNNEEVEEAVKQAYICFFRKRYMPPSQTALFEQPVVPTKRKKINDEKSMPMPKPIAAIIIAQETQLLPAVMRKCGSYDCGRQYESGDVITFNGQLNCSLQDNNRQHVNRTTHWARVSHEQLAACLERDEIARERLRNRPAIHHSLANWNRFIL
jgi:hypothetical protein